MKHIDLPPKKIKVLGCPQWIRYVDRYHGAQQALRSGYEEIEPPFMRDGLYLVNTSFTVLEYGGRAWVGVDSKDDVEPFREELQWAEYKDVSFLSRNQAQALRALTRAGLATNRQRYILCKHESRRQAKFFGLKLRKGFPGGS